MKRRGFRIIGVWFVLCFAAHAVTNDVIGTWRGNLAVGPARLRILFHISQGADGTLKATMDSPDQSASGIPVDRVTFTNVSIRLDAVMQWCSRPECAQRVRCN